MSKNSSNHRVEEDDDDVKDYDNLLTKGKKINYSNSNSNDYSGAADQNKNGEAFVNDQELIKVPTISELSIA